MSRVTLISPFGKGTMTVADDKTAERYTAAGWVKEGAKPRAASSEPEGDPSESWTLPQLKAHAAANEIDLGGATRKDDVLAAISGASTAEGEGGGESDDDATDSEK